MLRGWEDNKLPRTKQERISAPGVLGPVTRGRWMASPRLEKNLPPLEKCVGYSLKILAIVQKFLAPLRKHFAPPGVPSWLRAWLYLYKSVCWKKVFMMHSALLQHS